MTDVPQEVHAMARHWAGAGYVVSEASGQMAWRFRSGTDDGDGFVYEVRAPGVPVPVYEDSGRPVGTVVSDDWTVRCLNDAPDAWWTVSKDGVHDAYPTPIQLANWPAEDQRRSGL